MAGSGDKGGLKIPKWYVCVCMSVSMYVGLCKCLLKILFSYTRNLVLKKPLMKREIKPKETRGLNMLYFRLKMSTMTILDAYRNAVGVYKRLIRF